MNVVVEVSPTISTPNQIIILKHEKLSTSEDLFHVRTRGPRMGKT
jgi:hypothetical protein